MPVRCFVAGASAWIGNQIRARRRRAAHPISRKGEHANQTLLTFRCYLQRTAARSASDPLNLNQTEKKSGAQSARQMRSPLAPIETRPAERPLGILSGGQIQPEVHEEPLPLLGNEASILIERDEILCRQGIDQRDGKSSSDMIVTGSRNTQSLVSGSDRMMPNRTGDSYDHQGLHRLRDFLRGQSIIAMATLLFDYNETCLGQLGEMATGRLRRHAGRPRELSCREGVSTHQRENDVRPRGIADQGCNLRNGISGCYPAHGPSVASSSRRITRG